MSKRSNSAELIFLFKIGLSYLMSKLSLISSTNLLFQFVKMANSSKEGILLQFKGWSWIVLSIDGVVILNVKDDIPICSQDLILVCKEISLRYCNGKNKVFFTTFVNWGCLMNNLSTSVLKQLSINNKEYLFFKKTCPRNLARV